MYLLEKGTVVPGHAIKAHKWSRGIAPFILKLSTKLEVSGQLQYCFNPMQITARTHSAQGWVGPQPVWMLLKKIKNLFPLSEIKPWTSLPTAHSLSPNNIHCQLQTIKLLITWFSPSSRHFLALRYKYFCQHPVLRHPHYTPTLHSLCSR